MYQRMIKEEIAKRGYIGKYNPRHIEAYMRLKFSTLDGLSGKQFAFEVGTAMRTIDADGIQMAEELAVSFAL